MINWLTLSWWRMTPVRLFLWGAFVYFTVHDGWAWFLALLIQECAWWFGQSKGRRAGYKAGVKAGMDYLMEEAQKEVEALLKADKEQS